MRLIDTDALKYTQIYEPYGNGQYKAVNIVYETDIDSAPTIDPVKHGRWISVPNKKNRICSRCECNEPYKFADKNADVFDYCPHCGAKMDVKEQKSYVDWVVKRE